MFTNSSLINTTILSPNCTYPRRDTIKKITIHHMADKLTVKECGDYFSKAYNKSSCNYGIDSKGGIALYVPEESRAWSSSNQSNDHQAITIEVSNTEKKYPYRVSDIAIQKTIELCIDICKRNNIKKLNFTYNADGNLTAHRFFVNTSCPGNYLYGMFPYIAEQVNKGLMKKYYKIQVMTLDNKEIANQVKEKLINLGFNDTAIVEFVE